jgi:hypothetical protein
VKCSFRPNRREFLTVGAIGVLGVSLADLLAVEAAQSKGAAAPKAKAIIHIFLPGGMAQQESFDPKPYAPLEYRGSFGVVNTKIPGVVFCETMPQIAQIADKITVIRSMTHGEAAHERGTHTMFTGYQPSPALVFPSMGSVLSHELGPRENLPPYVCIPRSAGFSRSRSHGPPLGRGWKAIAGVGALGRAAPLRVAFSDDGDRVAAGDWAGQILVWTISGKAAGPVRLPTNP